MKRFFWVHFLQMSHSQCLEKKSAGGYGTPMKQIAMANIGLPFSKKKQQDFVFDSYGRQKQNL